MEERRDYAAAVINHNGGELVLGTVGSLKRLTPPPDEIVVVDDGSTDGSPERLRAKHPDVRLVSMGHNTARPTRVRNRALRETRHRYVLLTDNDVTFAPDAVRHLMGVLQDRADAAVALPTYVCDDGDRTRLYSCPGAMHFLCWSVDYSEVTTVGAARALGVRPAIGGGIQLIDKKCAASVGLFDEDLAFGWGDDGELHHRLRLAGFGCYLAPEALVFHPPAQRGPRFYGQIHNRWLTLLKDYQLRTLVLAAPALAVFELLLIAFMIGTGRGGDYVRALGEVAGKLGRIREERCRIQALRRVPDRDLLSDDKLDMPRQLKPLAAVMRALSIGFSLYWRLIVRLAAWGTAATCRERARSVRWSAGRSLLRVSRRSTRELPAAGEVQPLSIARKDSRCS